MCKTLREIDYSSCKKLFRTMQARVECGACLRALRQREKWRFS
jgi:bacterioferritin-associated ferredoxin